MKLQIAGATIYLGRRRRDGFYNVERVRQTNLRTLLPALRRAELRSRMDGKRLYVRTDDPNQLLLPFRSEAG